MGIAQRMLTAMLPVRAPGIVDDGARKARENARSIAAFLASAGVTHIVGQGLCAGAVNPVAFAFYPHSRLIAMEYRGGDQGVFDRFGNGLQTGVTLRECACRRRLAESGSKHIGKHLGATGEGTDRRGAETWNVLMQNAVLDACVLYPAPPPSGACNPTQRG